MLLLEIDTNKFLMAAPQISRKALILGLSHSRELELHDTVRKKARELLTLFMFSSLSLISWNSSFSASTFEKDQHKYSGHYFG